MTLWRALMEGLGWRVGREVAEDAIATVKKTIREESEPEDPAAALARLERQAREAAKAAARAEKEREKREKERARAVDRELAQLKKQVEREKKR